MSSTTRRRTTVVLWVVQGLLAALFLFAGGMKLFGPAAMLKGPMPLPVGFLRFIGLLELTGALGLILPGIFGIRTDLTVFAAIGLGIIMSGATGVSITAGQGALVQGIAPFVIGLLAGVVAFGRSRVVPLTVKAAHDSPVALHRVAA